MDEQPPVPQRQIALSIPPEAQALFSNATQVTVSDDSVIIQFAYVRPNAQLQGMEDAVSVGQLISEIALSPKHAIEFSRALDATIKQHFTRHLNDSVE